MSFVSPEAQLRSQEIDRENDLYRNYGYAYELNEATGCRVTDWGRPSKFDHIYCRDGLACKAASWVVLWVAVYVRDFPDRRNGYGINSGWKLWVRYPTKAFEDIHKLFELYLGTGGLYKRVSYCIEE